MASRDTPRQLATPGRTAVMSAPVEGERCRALSVNTRLEALRGLAGDDRAALGAHASAW